MKNEVDIKRFKVGTRVKIADSYPHSEFYTRGEEGTVIYNDNKNLLGVEFDRAGTNRHNCDRKCDSRRGRWVTGIMEYLIIIDKSLDHILGIY